MTRMAWSPRRDVEARERRGEAPATAARGCPARELRAEVDDLDARPGAARARSAGRPAGTCPARARPTLSTAGVALPRIAAAPASSARRRAVSRAWRRGRPVALVRPLVLLVDDDDADVGERGEDREARADDDVDVAGPDPPPLVRAFAFAEARVEQRDARLEIRAEPVDERHREGDLGDEDEGRPAGRERRGDRLDVDRGLAAAGHAVEEERRRVAGLDRLVGRGDGPCLLDGQGRACGSPAAQPDRPRRRAAGAAAP